MSQQFIDQILFRNEMKVRQWHLKSIELSDFITFPFWSKLLPIKRQPAKIEPFIFGHEETSTQEKSF